MKYNLGCLHKLRHEIRYCVHCSQESDHFRVYLYFAGDCTKRHTGGNKILVVFINLDMKLHTMLIAHKE